MTNSDYLHTTWLAEILAMFNMSIPTVTADMQQKVSQFENIYLSCEPQTNLNVKIVHMIQKSE